MSEKTQQYKEQGTTKPPISSRTSFNDVLNADNTQGYPPSNIQEAIICMLPKSANELVNCLARAACILVGVLDYLYSHDLTRFFLLIGIAIGYTTVQEGINLFKHRN
jgi:hypothetical protein